ncbi:hypothetical protein GBA52_001439 [Prunus armeniaca]|nr:hypothetical protein GBA52_001439 [Prunus armeniaca]
MVTNIINKNGQTNNHQKTHVRHMAKVPTYPHHQGLLQWVKRCVPSPCPLNPEHIPFQTHKFFASLHAYFTQPNNTSKNVNLVSISFIVGL